jgi:Na+/H+-dicarboxylate symporter
MSLASKVLLGLGLGAAVGLFFGERVAFLGEPGRAFVVLLQMTVLPYVSVALVHGLGRLSVADARAVARYAGSSLLVIWTVTLAVVSVVPLVFPDWKATSFFSTSLLKEAPPFDPIGLYLPANPFRALAEGVVPAVVVFSVAVGLALMVAERKRPVVEVLGALEDSLQRVAGFVVSLAPYGVFAIAGHAAGTLRGDDLLGLQVYAAAYVVAALALAFWILPMLVTALTPLAYRDVVGHARAALLTAFATGSVFVVLPILSLRAKEVLERRADTRDSRHLVDVIVPIAFTLASAGKLLAMTFVLFAGWISGFPLGIAQLPQFLVTGIFSFFASTTIAIPFLLDLFRIPADTFQLFLIADSVVGNRFGSMLAAVHILSLALLGVCGAAGVLRIRGVRLLRWGAVALVLVVGGLGGLRLAFESVDRPYAGYETFIGRGLLLPQAPVRELQAPTARRPGPALERILADGVLRVGWARDLLPFVFRNDRGELVGFDVEMAHALARDFGVALELVEIPRQGPEASLASGLVDVLMTGLVVTPERLGTMRFSDPYLEMSLCLIVPDHRRDEFNSRKALSRHARLRLGVPPNSYYADKIQRYLPQAELVELASPREFFRGSQTDLDGMLFAAESGSAWTLIYPEFTVAIPHPDLLKVPVAYAVAKSDVDLADFLSQWILLKRRDLTIDRLFEYWFQGTDPPEARERRWSLLDDVLRWSATTGPP